MALPEMSKASSAAVCGFTGIPSETSRVRERVSIENFGQAGTGGALCLLGCGRQTPVLREAPYTSLRTSGSGPRGRFFLWLTNDWQRH